MRQIYFQLVHILIKSLIAHFLQRLWFTNATMNPSAFTQNISTNIFPWAPVTALTKIIRETRTTTYPPASSIDPAPSSNPFANPTTPHHSRQPKQPRFKNRYAQKRRNFGELSRTRPPLFRGRRVTGWLLSVVRCSGTKKKCSRREKAGPDESPNCFSCWRWRFLALPCSNVIGGEVG